MAFFVLKYLLKSGQKDFNSPTHKQLTNS